MIGHDHPMFTRLYRVIAALGEHTGVAQARGEALAAARGRLLIVGLGPGHDLDHLPGSVTAVVAVEPSASMRRAARARVAETRRRGIEVELIDAVGEDLPLSDDSVDAVLFAYVLCSVDDPDRVIAEAARVLRPGGTWGILEHVRATEGTWSHRLQRWSAPVWPRVTGGCHADRDTAAALSRGGVSVDSLRRLTVANVPVVAPTLLGSA